MMYLPGLREIAIFFLVIILLFISTLVQSTALATVALGAAGLYFTATRSRQILERVYKDRVLLLLPVDLNIVQVAGRNDHIVATVGRGRRARKVYIAYLRVRDYDPASRLGYAAERAIAALHNPAVTTGVAAVCREGGYDYFTWVAGAEKKVVAAAIREVVKQLHASGVYVTPADPMEVLPSVARTGGRSFGWTVPIFTIAAAVLAGLGVLQPVLLPLALPFLPLIPSEFRIVRPGSVQLVPLPAMQLEYSGFKADEAAAASMVRTASAMASVAREGSFALACLKPADTALVEAKAKAAFEVLDSARAGIAKTRDELKAARWLEVWRALQDGAVPFQALVLASPELARDLQKVGLKVGWASRLTALEAVLGVASGQLSVTPQIAWLAPQTFLRPRTRRTPKAIYLGHGVRRDEEVWLEVDLLENVHGLIVGPMGSGKSTTARTLALRAMEKGITPIIVDPSGEYRAFAERFRFEIIDLWDRQLDIAGVNAYDLRRAFDYLAPLSDYEFVRLQRAGDAGDLWSSGLEKLELVKPYFAKAVVSPADILSAGKPFVLCMGSTATGKYVPLPVEVQRFAFTCLLAQLRDYVIAQGLAEPRWMLIVDEGHLFARPTRLEMESPLATMARMLRKFGLAVVLVTHDWSDVDDAYREHAGWRLALSHSDPQYIEKTQVYMALTPSELTWFRRGVRGRGVLRRGFEPHNILLEIEPAEGARTDYYHQSPS
ncbi:MAG: DUF87 domain-containing protein [Thermofilaceae archaeon]